MENLTDYIVADAEIEMLYRNFLTGLDDPKDTVFARLTFYMASIQILWDDPFDDPKEHHLFIERLEYHRTLTLAKLVYRMFFRK